MPQPQPPREEPHAEKGDEAARKNDPHGVGSQKDEGDKPTAYPRSDRHETERAASKDN